MRHPTPPGLPRSRWLVWAPTKASQLPCHAACTPGGVCPSAKPGASCVPAVAPACSRLTASLPPRTLCLAPSPRAATNRPAPAMAFPSAPALATHSPACSKPVSAAMRCIDGMCRAAQLPSMLGHGNPQPTQLALLSAAAGAACTASLTPAAGCAAPGLPPRRCVGRQLRRCQPLQDVVRGDRRTLRGPDPGRVDFHRAGGQHQQVRLCALPSRLSLRTGSLRAGCSDGCNRRQLSNKLPPGPAALATSLPSLPTPSNPVCSFPSLQPYGQNEWSNLWTGYLVPSTTGCAALPLPLPLLQPAVAAQQPPCPLLKRSPLPACHLLATATSISRGLPARMTTLQFGSTCRP